METIFQKLQVLGHNTNEKLNDLFRQKVQLEDKLKDIESQIHYARGVLDTVGETEGYIRERQDQLKNTLPDVIPVFKTTPPEDN